MPPSYTIPYAPQDYYRPSNLREITELIMRGGDIQAQRALQSGQIWGNAIAGIGDALGQGVQAYAQNKEAERKKAEEKQRISARTQAIDELFSQEGPVDPRQIIRVFGPEDGVSVIKALDAVNPKNAPSYKDRMEAARDAALGVLKMPPARRAQAYDFARQGLISGGLFKPEELPEQFDENTENLITQAAGWGAKPEKVEAPKPISLDLQLAEAYAKGDKAKIDEILRLKGREAAATRAPEKPTGPEKPDIQMVNGMPYLVQQDGTLKPATLPGGAPLPPAEGKGASDDESRAGGLVAQMKSAKSLSDEIFTGEGVTQKLKSAGRAVAAKAGYDPKFKVYQDTRSSIAASIAVAIQGSRPSDADVFRSALPMIPDLVSDTKESARMKWAIITDMFEKRLSPEAKKRIGFESFAESTRPQYLSTDPNAGEPIR